MNDSINRQAAIDMIKNHKSDFSTEKDYRTARACVNAVPPAQPTLNGYNIKHLLLIAELLEKENLPPERVSDALHNIGQVVAIVKKEYEEALRKAVE